MIPTSIRGLFLVRAVPVCNYSCGTWGIWLDVVDRNARIYIDSIVDIVLRKDGIV